VIAAVSSEVWLPILTLLLGYAFSLITEAVRDRRQSERERQAREAEREAIKDAQTEEADRRRKEFQRETLLELQEVLHDLGRTYGHQHYADVRNARRTGFWKQGPSISEETTKMSEEANRRSNILLARIDDERLRELVRTMKDAGANLLLAISEQESADYADRSIAAFAEANERASGSFFGRRTRRQAHRGEPAPDAPSGRALSRAPRPSERRGRTSSS